MRYVLLRQIGKSVDDTREFLNLELETDRFILFRMYFDEESIRDLEFYDTDNPDLKQLINNSIRDIIFILLNEKSKKLGETFDQISSKAVDAFLKNNYEEYYKINAEKRKFYFEEVLTTL
jgi:hypothetical protein